LQGLLTTSQSPGLEGVNFAIPNLLIATALANP